MKTYHYTPAMKRNFRRYIIDIVYIGYAESHGRYWDDTGSCWGLLQFQHIGKCTGAGCGRGWHLNKRDKERHKKLHKRYKNVRDWRLCPECSVYRIARAYKEGGKATLDQHWAATLGR